MAALPEAVPAGAASGSSGDDDLQFTLESLLQLQQTAKALDPA